MIANTRAERHDGNEQPGSGGVCPHADLSPGGHGAIACDARTSLEQRLSVVERENRLLRGGLKQLTRIRQNWNRALQKLKQTKARLEVSKQFVERLLQTAPLPVVVLDRDDGVVMMANAAAEALVGSAAGELVGRQALSLLEPLSRQCVLRLYATGTPNVRPPCPPEVQISTLHGELRLVEVHWSDVEGSAGAKDCVVVMLRDITDQRQAEERLRYLSLHDALTGLANRVLFRDRLELALARSQRHGLRTVVLALDLDGFKHVNDSLGHSAGDDLLRQVAARLRGVTREDDTAARFGGDEFAVLVTGVQQVRDIEMLARRMLESVSQPYALGGEMCSVTASMGISVFPDHSRDIDELIKFADLAMYRAKAQGRDLYQFFSAEMSAEVTLRRNLLGRMQRALDEGQFVLHYQPQVEIRTRRIRAVEALVRWNHPESGVIPPAHFIGLAEETGFITMLGEYVLREACRQTAAWHEQGLTDLTVSVNLSARQFQDHDLIATVKRVLAETGLAAANLDLEITESTVIRDLEAAERVLHELRGLGVRLSLDDFGTGYASMAHLKRLPFSELKIDRQFVRDLETDPHDSAISDAIIRMAGALGLTVVAEGVETEGQLRRLASLRCDRAQGYFFARPLAADECFRFLATCRT